MVIASSRQTSVAGVGGSCSQRAWGLPGTEREERLAPIESEARLLREGRGGYEARSALTLLKPFFAS